VPLRLVMMGTGRFALPVFEALHESAHHLAGLFTQPDRRGRGHHRHRNPLKESAEAHGTPVFQPESVNAPESVQSLRNLEADLCVVAAYGQILSAEVIATPRLGCINVHASLLPKYRGAAPVHHAILNGEAETGVTVFQIEPKLDAGVMLGHVQTPIGPDETTGELEARLAELAVPVTLQVIEELEQGRASPQPQDNTVVTKAPLMKKSFGRINWSQTAKQIANHVRAMQPWPTAFTFLSQSDEKPLRVILTDVTPRETVPGQLDGAEPGTVVFADKATVVVQVGEGVVEIRRLRPEGKREMTAAEFQHGHALQPGDRFTADDSAPASR